MFFGFEVQQLARVIDKRSADCSLKVRSPPLPSAL